MPTSTIANQMIGAAQELCAAVSRLKFRAPVACVYNPLDYAWSAHEAYLRGYADTRRSVVFVGMNPGPYGMVQTGVPFGEVGAVREWLKIENPVGSPARQHLKRPVEGFACQRSEVSGRRLWGLFAERFGEADKFFACHFVANYCPLAFFDEAGRNFTPDRLSPSQADALFSACDRHLRRVAGILRPEWLVGVGGFAWKRALQVMVGTPVHIGRILHPSPASPAANKDWAGTATAQLKALGVW